MKDKKRFCNAIETRKQYVKNQSNEQLTDEQVTLLSCGLKIIPTPMTKENLIRHQLLADFNQFARRMRLQYIFHGEENEPHPFHWEPPVQPSVALETFLEEVKLDLASVEFSDKPKDNIYRRAPSSQNAKSYRAAKALFLRNLIKVTPPY